MSVSHKAFAELLIQAFRYAGESRPIYHDEGSFKLFLPGQDHTFWIGNLFTEFLQTKDQAGFFESAWEIWSSVQADLPKLPHWIPEMIRPFRDETHPLSYRVEQLPGERFWTVAPPFDEQAEQPHCEHFDLTAAYQLWWGNQYQRACKKHLRNIYHWLTSGQVTEGELLVLSELRRLWRCGRLVPGYDTRLTDELRWLGRTSELPPKLSECLNLLPQSFESIESAVSAFRQLRNKVY